MKHASLLLVWCHPIVHKPQHSYSARNEVIYTTPVSGDASGRGHTNAHPARAFEQECVQTLHPPLHRHSAE